MTATDVATETATDTAMGDVTTSTEPAADAPGEEGHDRRSLLALWHDSYAGVTELAQAEVLLLRVETHRNLRRLWQTIICLAIGLCLLLPAIAFLATAALLALIPLIGIIPAALLMALLCGFVAVALIGIARYRLVRQAILPHRSLMRLSTALQTVSGGRTQETDSRAVKASKDG